MKQTAVSRNRAPSLLPLRKVRRTKHLFCRKLLKVFPPPLPRSLPLQPFNGSHCNFRPFHPLSKIPGRERRRSPAKSGNLKRGSQSCKDHVAYLTSCDKSKSVMLAHVRPKWTNSALSCPSPSSMLPRVDIKGGPTWHHVDLQCQRLGLTISGVHCMSVTRGLQI